MKILLITLTVIGGMFAGLAGCATVTSTPASPTLPAFQPRPTYTPEARIESSPLQVEVFCSPTRMHTSIVHFSWQASEEEAKVQQLQVTVFKQGFERGVFGTFSPLQDKRLNVDTKIEGIGVILEAKNIMTGLQRLDAALLSYTPEEQRVTVEIANLEPGLLYFVRLQSAGQTVGSVVKFDAPVCTADLETGED